MTVVDVDCDNNDEFINQMKINEKKCTKGQMHATYTYVCM